VDSLACPRSGEQMTLRTVLVGPSATVNVLTGLKLSARGPRDGVGRGMPWAL
jgi:hypothetical protein